MFRYYLVRDRHMPKAKDEFGHWHAIHLGSHGDSGKGWNALVLHDRHIDPHKNWIAFPKVLDHKTPIRDKLKHALLADVGLTGDETTLEASEKLAAIFAPFAHP